MLTELSSRGFAARRALHSVDVMTVVVSYLQPTALLPVVASCRSFRAAATRCIDSSESILESELKHFCCSGSMLLFAKGMGCPWDVLGICRFAAEGGHLDVLQSIKQYINYRFAAMVCSIACSRGHIPILRWLRGEAQFDRVWKPSRCSEAASTGQVGVLRWLLQEVQPPCPCDEGACTAAAESGHLHVLEWLRSTQPPCPWGPDTCAAAAQGGHLHILKWLREENSPPCPWDRYCCETAAAEGNLAMLLWLRGVSCPPCPWSRQDCRSVAPQPCPDLFRFIDTYPSDTE